MTPDGATRHGPNLPYSLVAGVTPCPGGWLVASAKLQGTIFAPEDPTKLERFIDVVDQRPSYSTVALNAPVGYLSHTAEGGRSCDREVRALLGGRGAAVKSAPVRLDSQRATSTSCRTTSTPSAKRCCSAIERWPTRWRLFASERSTRSTPN